MQKQSGFILFSHKPKCRVFVSSSELGEVLIFNSQCNIWWTVALLEPAKAGMLGKKICGQKHILNPHSPGSISHESVRSSRWWILKYFLCSPRNLGKMNPFWRAYFSKGLVQPPTSYVLWVDDGFWFEFNGRFASMADRFCMEFFAFRFWIPTNFGHFFPQYCNHQSSEAEGTQLKCRVCFVFWASPFFF